MIVQFSNLHRVKSAAVEVNDFADERLTFGNRMSRGHVPLRPVWPGVRADFPAP
jgi:hypothetical protein